MKIIKGIFIIPGSVVGMVLMFLSLLLGIVKEDSVREVAEFLTGNMTLFFLPAFMGIMDLWGILKVNFWGWIAVVAISTVAVLVSSGWVQQGIEYITGKEDAE
mgnify:FL=1